MTKIESLEKPATGRATSSRGESTRERILDAAESIILGNGFSAASIDRVLAAGGLTKGAFFYHFPSKDALIQSLIERYVAREARDLSETMARAERMARDPLQQLLIALGLIIEDAEARLRVSGPNPGCLYGSYAYEVGTVAPRNLEILRQSTLDYRHRIREKLDEIVARRPPRLETDLDTLADGLLVAFEGGLILGRVLGEPMATVQHLRHYRNHLELLFSDEA